MERRCMLFLCLVTAVLLGSAVAAEDASTTETAGVSRGVESAEIGIRQVWVVPGGTGLFGAVDGHLAQAVLGGTRVTVLEEEEGWLRVHTEEGIEGWVRSSGVRDEPPPAPKPVEQSTIVTAHYTKIGAAISYPARTATTDAIRRMASGEVACRPGRCAAAVAEALGWGWDLGDAHAWTGLPTHGFQRRVSADEAEPGDITVWPFTFGRRGSQHIGFAVLYEGAVTLLSNLTGHVQLSPMVPGYAAFAPPPV